jgi:uncharacterized protein (DUF2141 family)
MVKLISLVCLLSLFSVGLGDKSNTDCTLSVQFNNIRSKEGKLYIFIYNYENQYPDNPYRYYEVRKNQIRNSKLLVNIPKLEKGKYALSILDDENSNDDLDMFLGIPTEGYAFSNNVKPFLSMPNYHDLLFEVNSKHQLLKLDMRYVL